MQIKLQQTVPLRRVRLIRRTTRTRHLRTYNNSLHIITNSRNWLRATVLRYYRRTLRVKTNKCHRSRKWHLRGNPLCCLFNGHYPNYLVSFLYGTPMNTMTRRTRGAIVNTRNVRRQLNRKRVHSHLLRRNFCHPLNCQRPRPLGVR